MLQLYHCSNDLPRTRTGIWLSEIPQRDYGSKVYEFEIDEEFLNLADIKTLKKYITLYDLNDWDSLSSDEFLQDDDKILDYQDEIDSGDISEENAYNEYIDFYLDNGFLEVILYHPYEYNWYRYLKEDYYDGYYFPAEQDENVYYYIFDDKNAFLVRKLS